MMGQGKLTSVAVLMSHMGPLPHCAIWGTDLFGNLPTNPNLQSFSFATNYAPKTETITMYAIEINGLTKRYGNILAVDHLTLQMEEGELLSLLGVNGAGKTTTVKMLSCLTSPTEGDAYLLGKSIRRDPTAVKSLIAVSPQETAIAPGLTARENLDLICGIHGFSRDKKDQRIAELTRLLGLESILNRKAGKLSGGWQRRLSIAMALVSEPKILFLDEPTLGLDVLARADLWEIIRSLKGKVTVILTTHYMEEAEALSDRVAIMRDGRLLACDTPRGIKDATGTDSFEQAFIAVVKGVNS